MSEEKKNTVIVTTSSPEPSNLPARFEPRCEIDAPALITTSGDGARYAYEEFKGRAAFGRWQGPVRAGDVRGAAEVEKR